VSSQPDDLTPNEAQAVRDDDIIVRLLQAVPRPQETAAAQVRRA
jgi:hypothetical protein